MDKENKCEVPIKRSMQQIQGPSKEKYATSKFIKQANKLQKWNLKT